VKLKYVMHRALWAILPHYDLVLYGPRDRWGTDFYSKMRLLNRLLWWITVVFYRVEFCISNFGSYRVNLPCDEPGYKRYTYKRWCRLPDWIVYPVRRVRHWLEFTSCGY
jgi:hypothetical protein